MRQKRATCHSPIWYDTSLSISEDVLAAETGLILKKQITVELANHLPYLSS